MKINYKTQIILNMKKQLKQNQKSIIILNKKEYQNIKLIKKYFYFSQKKKLLQVKPFIHSYLHLP